METSSFRMPVRVRVSGKPIEVGSVEDAVKFLEEWPEHRRGPVHRCALLACTASMGGTMSHEEARRAFESFVRITGLSPPTYSSRLPPSAFHGRGGRPIVT